MPNQEYDFNKIEEKWQKEWESSKSFEVFLNKNKEKYYCLEMFPYPSGEGLHIGHALNYTIGDIYARFKRMKGFNVLHPMGYDSLGLPAENAAIKIGIHPEDYTNNAIKNYILQQKKLGISYDWSRVFNTSDPNYYKWDQWIFLKMFEKGLAYRKKALVNWCPKCNTVLANEQVHNGKCWRHEDTDVEVKPLEQWFFRIRDYAERLLDFDNLDWPENTISMQKNWIGKSFGAEILFEIEKENNEKEKFFVFTTRPDTIYGVTFMVLSAQHERLFDFVSEKQKLEVEKFLKKLKSVSEKDLVNLEKEGVFSGSYAINPLTKEKIPIYIGNFVVADYGSGMVMAVPAHDQRDFEFAKKYNLPIKPVILKQTEESYSFVMGVGKQEIKKLGIKIVEKTKEGFLKIKIPLKKIEAYKKFIRENMQPNFWNEFSTKNGFHFIFKHKDGRIEEFDLNEKTNDLIERYGMAFNDEEPKDKPENVYLWLAKNDFYKELLIHGDSGRLINSGKFTGMDNEKAKQEIIKELEKRGLGKKSVQYRLKDWLISRQRYWGTPIPIVYCDNCGIVPIPEKELPVELPRDVKFGEGNPLTTNKEWVNTTCPVCKSPAKRETDTMDTFVNSSWYFLRYCDPANDKEIFDKKKVNYWMPIDLYIGGKEHATMHLIYFRFYTKFLKDLRLLDFDEPTLKLFHQGMLHASDGRKMSKSLGNVINPLEIINKYGADSLRLALVSFASPDSNINWDEKVLQGSFNFLNKVYKKISEIKIGKSKPKTEHKLNKTIKDITEYIDSLKHNLAVIKIRDLFSYFGEEESKEVIEGFLKLLSVFCPHIAEELWVNLGNKGFISLSDWPKVDESKINEMFDKQEEFLNNLISDINNVLRILKEKNEFKKRCFIYVLPNEKDFFSENLDEIKKRTGILDISLFAINDPDKYDPENKSKKVKPGKPGIYFE